MSYCVLAAGFTGDTCEINYDDCQLSPCKNNATCIDGVDNYTCICVDGYLGYNCSTEIDECQSSPCGDAGVCTDMLNGFSVSIRNFHLLLYRFCITSGAELFSDY